MPNRRPVAERFWPKVDIHGPMVSLQLGPCWEWTGAQDGKGYGRLSSGGSGNGRFRAHRISYELTKGAIPPELEIDHLCRKKNCVNPAHLEAVPHQINARRGEVGKAGGRREKAKTHCPQGHPYDAIHTYTDKNGKRSCKTCKNDRRRERTQLSRHGGIVT